MRYRQLFREIKRDLIRLAVQSCCGVRVMILPSCQRMPSVIIVIPAKELFDDISMHTSYNRLSFPTTLVCFSFEGPAVSSSAIKITIFTGSRMSVRKLPIIDFSNGRKGSLGGRGTVAAQLDLALRTHGCFYLINHGIERSSLKTCFELVHP
jgi:hypothetical protein